MQFLSQVPSVILLIVGFGFVIFFHELGHFLAAKWVDIKVEQFAVGFGQALFAWRKGLGVRFGTTTKEYEKRVQAKLDETRSKERETDLQLKEQLGYSAEHFKRASDELGLGETEYRLNWIPLGGYVKMLGQDDLRPGASADDPRAYNKKSIGARMIVVSAGVIMNVILAAVGFMIVFLIGFKAAPAVVGNVLPGSPAQNAYRLVNGKPEAAGLQVGDRILYFDDKFQHDFTKITLNTALVEEGKAVPMLVRRVDGKEDHIFVIPQRPEENAKAFLMLGIAQPYQLSAMEARDTMKDTKEMRELLPPETFLIKPGDVVTQINGQDVRVKEDAYKLDVALQESHGKPVQLTVSGPSGTRQISVKPIFQEPFGREAVNFAGMLMRPTVRMLPEYSTAIGQLIPGDVILAISDPSGEIKNNATTEEFKQWLNSAGQKDLSVDVRVLRDGKEVDVRGLRPTAKIDKSRYGLGVYLGNDQDNPVVAGTVPDSSAKAAGIPSGARIIAVNEKPVSNWFEVRDAMMTGLDKPIVVAADIDGVAKKFDLPKLSKEEADAIRGMRYSYGGLPLREMNEPRQTNNPITAAAWGVTETRDSILQFYLTLRRMVQGSVSYQNAMGPVGIIYAGAKFAYRGTDWLIWFLSMISANLAVVNFLPIPIVDGGLFTFLIIEKIQGKPLSQRAQSIAQVVGLAVLLGVFLLVTYQDIARLPFMSH